jgi:hypothetical protein
VGPERLIAVARTVGARPPVPAAFFFPAAACAEPDATNAGSRWPSHANTAAVRHHHFYARNVVALRTLIGWLGRSCCSQILSDSLF